MKKQIKTNNNVFNKTAKIVFVVTFLSLVIGITGILLFLTYKKDKVEKERQWFIDSALTDSQEIQSQINDLDVQKEVLEADKEIKKIDQLMSSIEEKKLKLAVFLQKDEALEQELIDSYDQSLEILEKYRNYLNYDLELRQVFKQDFYSQYQQEVLRKNISEVEYLLLLTKLKDNYVQMLKKLDEMTVSDELQAIHELETEHIKKQSKALIKGVDALVIKDYDKAILELEAFFEEKESKVYVQEADRLRQNFIDQIKEQLVF